MELFIVLLISAAIFGAVAYFGKQRADRLTAEGKIIKRDGSFWKYSEVFTLTGVDYDKVLSAVNNTYFSDLKVTIYPDNGGRKEILFKSSHEWNAVISLQSAEGDTYKYRFSFSAWSTYRGVPMRLDTMNMMETKVEKMFLNLDPKTVVTTQENKLKAV